MGASYSSMVQHRELTEEELQAQAEQDRIIYGLLLAVAVLWVLRWLWKRFTGLHKTKVDAEYEYIVVGSSAGGCVVAHRLVKEGKKVLLLEAGQDDTLHDMTFYGSYTHNLVHTVVDWCHKTTVPLLGDRELVGTNGKIVGGSAAINENIYQRPAKHELDSLQKLGIKGWSYADCLPYFLKSEGTTLFDDKHHNKKGPQQISFTPVRSPIGKLAADAVSDLGVTKCLDSNSPDAIGVSPTQLAVDKKGLRQTPFTAFIRPLLKRKNLTVRSEATVEKVEFEGTKAVGVTWTGRSGSRTTTKCTGEVILCAGAVGSAAILLRSGVGEGGDVAENKGVGRNLRDLLTVPLIYQTRNGVSYDSNNIHTLQHFIAFKMSGHGPALAYPVDTHMYLSSRVNGLMNSWKEEKVNKLEVHKQMANTQHDHLVTLVSSGGFRRHDFERRGISLHIARFTEAMSFGVTAAQRYEPSANHGSVKIVDGEVVTDCCYLRSEDDLKQSFGILRLMRKLATTDPLSRILTKREAVDTTLLKSTPTLEAVDLMYGRRAIKRVKTGTLPEEDVKGLKKIQQEIDGEEYLLAYVKKHAQPFNNQVGTCSMAPLHVADGKTMPPVVDSQDLCVRGTESLRVADSSILPFSFTAPGVATELMIGERAASMILKEKVN
eukprot:TRINITY_DN24072_c0_g1_i1.p1 TRINITY_DN24072_c0_g1~~TRINITY_DN24072_c0_g1_i1.p1  ORF type:complete len:669 (+),score=266.23 TRINITY_DN24072_c0_g1_i1:33-2009(+)